MRLLSGLLLLAWLLGAIFVQNGWDKEKGFGTALRHLVGANLPILPAAAALLGVLTVPMNQRGQRILHAWISLLNLFALLPTLVLVFYAWEDFSALLVIPLALALHARWLGVSLRLLEPLYGLDMAWLSPRPTLDE